MKLTIDTGVILGLLKIAPKKDVRYYLNDINVELDGHDATLVATNGHMLAAVKCELVSENENYQNIIIPCSALDILKLKPRKKLVIDASTYPTLTFDYNGTGLRCNAVDAKYPDWRRVIPKTVSGEAAMYNSDYIAAMAGALMLISGRKKVAEMTVLMNGSGPALITSPAAQNFVGVLMPMWQSEDSCVITEAPAWATK